MPKTLPVTITLNDLSSLFEKSEKRVLKEVKKIVNEELKPYARADRLQEAVDAIMHGMEEMDKNTPKRSEVVMKKDLANLYTNINA